MLTPFQRLLYCARQASKFPTLLLTASGPTIRAFNLTEGTYVSKWTHLKGPEIAQKSHDQSPGSVEKNEGPLQKRRKLSEDHEPSDAPSTEIVLENGSKRRRRPKREAFTIPSVTHLLGTADGKHVVAVTGEDKCVRVLEMLENGSLKQISERVMPKRPSAITMSSDQETILCADKFGDVYALPLLGLSYEEPTPSNASNESSNINQSKVFYPSANATTIHTQKNIRALQSQLRQQELSNGAKPKAPKFLNFEHSLLLGHVSLLTDILSLTLPSPINPNKTRSYILTSDRDEHIRVSRGVPQAHVIETYCLAHHNFVSKLHVPTWAPQTLISGGGDDYLLIWDWVAGKVQQKVDLRALVDEIWISHPGKPITTATESLEEPKESKPATTTPPPIAVSGLYSLRTSLTESKGFLILTLEATPAIILFTLSASGTLTHHKTLHTSSNVLDIAPIPEQPAFLYALDAAHAPFSRDQPRQPSDKEADFLGGFAWNGEDWAVSPALAGIVQGVRAFASREEDDGTVGLDAAALGELFYGIEHLRKRRGEADVDAEGDVEAAGEEGA